MPKDDELTHEAPQSVFVVLCNGRPISVCASGGEASVAAPDGAKIVEYQASCPDGEPPRPDKLDALLGTLQEQLLDRYNACEDFAATPCSILLATLNAVAEAYKKVRGGAMRFRAPDVSNYNIWCDIERELAEARQKFPDNAHLMNALTEEVGELAQALLHINFEPGKNGHEDVYKEAIQVAVMAIRVASEGDSTLPAYHPESGYRGPNWIGYAPIAGVENIDDMFIAAMEELGRVRQDEITIQHPLWVYLTGKAVDG